MKLNMQSEGETDIEHTKITLPIDVRREIMEAAEHIVDYRLDCWSAGKSIGDPVSEFDASTPIL